MHTPTSPPPRQPAAQVPCSFPLPEEDEGTPALRASMLTPQLLTLVSKACRTVTPPWCDLGPQAPSGWEAAPGTPQGGCTARPRKGLGVTLWMLLRYLLCLPSTTNLLLYFFSLHATIVIVWSRFVIKNGEGYCLYSKSSWNFFP